MKLAHSSEYKKTQEPQLEPEDVLNMTTQKLAHAAVDTLGVTLSTPARVLQLEVKDAQKTDKLTHSVEATPAVCLTKATKSKEPRLKMEDQKTYQFNPNSVVTYVQKAKQYPAIGRPYMEHSQAGKPGRQAPSDLQEG